jgi:hypothetical protein
MAKRSSQRSVRILGRKLRLFCQDKRSVVRMTCHRRHPSPSDGGMPNKQRHRREKKRERPKHGAKSGEKNDAKSGGKRREKDLPHGNPVPSGAFAVCLPKTYLTMTVQMSKNIGAKSEVMAGMSSAPPTFLRLMRSRLTRDRDCNCEPFYIQGARGALFKLTPPMDIRVRPRAPS